MDIIKIDKIDFLEDYCQMSMISLIELPERSFPLNLNSNYYDWQDCTSKLIYRSYLWLVMCGFIEIEIHDDSRDYIFGLIKKPIKSYVPIFHNIDFGFDKLGYFEYLILSSFNKLHVFSFLEPKYRLMDHVRIIIGNLMTENKFNGSPYKEMILNILTKQIDSSWEIKIEKKLLGIWDKISLTIDKNIETEYKSKLYQYNNHLNLVMKNESTKLFFAQLKNIIDTEIGNRMIKDY